jgi:hypothetical protein
MNDVVVNDSQSVVVEVEERGLVTKEEVGGMDDSRSEYGCNFFDSRFENVKKVKSEKVVKPSNTLSKVVSGRCITESDVAEKVRVHVSQQSKKSVDYTDRISKKSSEKEMGSGKKDCNLKGKGKRKIVKNSNKKNVASLKPGPSHMYVDVSDLYVDSDEHDEIEEKDKCCVCRKFEPDAVRKSVSLIFVKWVQCDKCEHWTHLMFCTDVRVVRTESEFLCVHCK